MMLQTKESPSESTIPLSENSLAVLKRRYLRRGEDGRPIETVEEMFRRIAHHIAVVEAEHEADVAAAEETFYKLLTELRFMPNSPTFTGAGTPLGQLAACFVLPIEDDMGRNSAGIFQTLRDAALIQQTGGGNGFAFSRLRPKDDFVKSSAGRATGPVGFLRVYDQAFGEIAQGGCLLPETLVFTSRGLLRLDELVSTKESGWQEHRLQVATDQGWRASPRGYNNGVAPVMRVFTREGLSLAGTPEHRVKVMGDKGPEWRHLQDLQAGDWIIVRLGEHRGSFQALRQPKRQHGNQRWPQLPSLLDEELAFLLGYMTGDGFMASQPDDHRLGVSVAHNSYLMEEMPVIMERLFGAAVHQQQKPNDKSATFVIDNRAVKAFLQLNGLGKPRSREAYVPRLIRQSPPEVVGAYLRGLFEADGTLSHGYPSLMTTSPRLAEEVATLLIGLGCPVKIRSIASGVHRWGHSETYQLSIRSAVGLEAWRRKIGCDQRSRFVVAYAWESDQRRESSYRLPVPAYWLQPVLEAITLEQVDQRGRGMGVNFRSTEPRLRRSLLRYLRGDRQLTRSAYDELSRTYPQFADYAPSPEGFWFVQVRGVEAQGEALTLDLEVDDNHTYLAYGMVTHNTRRGANMAVLRVDHPDIFEFISCKANEYAITNFNISVGVTDAFVRAVRDDTDFDLINPRDGSVWRTVRARDIFDEIVKYAYNNGEPGVLFLDAANRANPVPHLYELEATNPCVTGDTLIYTGKGLRRAADLYHTQEANEVVVDGRFGVAESRVDASPVFYTGEKMVWRLETNEGYQLDATGNHRIMTAEGWMELQDLAPGMKIYILNRKGGFGDEGDLALGRTIGWLFGDSTFNIAGGAGLMFFGEEQSLAPAFAEYVNDVVGPGNHHNEFAPTRTYPIAAQKVSGREETRVISTRLKDELHKLNIHSKTRVPEVVFAGCEEMQRGFLQALFSADGTVLDKVDKGVSVRLWSSQAELLRDVQRLLLNFGIASKIFFDRKPGGYKEMPDGQGGHRSYYTQPGHELMISKRNLIRFQAEIGFLQEAKANKLLNALNRYGRRGPYGEYFVATVKSVRELGVQRVYDLTEPQTHSFIANGIVVHNCGEQWLGPYENCCLGSINLANHVTADGTIDWELLQRTVEESTHFLDNVVSANAYVPAVPQLKEAALRARRIGLGIMGLGDLMYKIGVRYGSEEGQALASVLFEFIRYHSMQRSMELARERGPFLAIKGSIYDGDNFRWSVPQPVVESKEMWGRPTLDWDSLVADIKTHGIRNAAQTTVAPTGTIATVSGCEGYGCEPVFALAYIRHVNDNGKDLQLQYTSPLFEQALLDAGLDEQTRQEIITEVNRVGSCQHIEALPEHIRHTFVVSSDITPEEHVRMQAAIQAFVDNSISKTCNFPPEATPEDVAKAYMLAWDLGCKGLTVYVTGSREKVTLETHATKAAKEKQEMAAESNPVKEEGQLTLWRESKKPRATILQGETAKINTPLGRTYITVNHNGDNQPFEVFIQTSKAGSDTAAVSDAIGRLISYILRLASPVSPRDRLKEVVKQLSGIGGGRPLGFGVQRVLSLPDGVAQVLADYLERTAEQSEAANDRPTANGHTNGTAHHVEQQPLAQPAQSTLRIGDLCPECGEAAVLNKEGCRTCASCGYSEC